MEIINQITETAKSWWIPIDKLQPGDRQEVFYLTNLGWTGRGYFEPSRQNGLWDINPGLGTVEYWIPVVMDMPGVEIDGWRNKE